MKSHFANYSITGIAFLFGCMAAAFFFYEEPSVSVHSVHKTSLSQPQPEAEMSLELGVQLKKNEQQVVSLTPSLSEKLKSKIEPQEKNVSYKKESSTISREELSKSIILSQTIDSIVNELSTSQVGGWGIDETEKGEVPWISVKPDSEISDEVAKLLQQNPDIEIRYDSVYSLDKLTTENQALRKVLDEIIDKSKTESSNDGYPLYSMVDMENNQLLIVLKNGKGKNEEMLNLLENHLQDSVKLTGQAPIKIISES